MKLECDLCKNQEQYPPAFIEEWRMLQYTGMPNARITNDQEGYGLFQQLHLCPLCAEHMSEAIRNIVKKREEIQRDKRAL